jgi:hypothetical protein
MQRDTIVEERLKQVENALRLADQAPSEAAREACRQLAGAWLQLARRSFDPPIGGEGAGSFIPPSGDLSHKAHESASELPVRA